MGDIYLDDEEEKQVEENEAKDNSELNVSKLLESTISKNLVSMSFDTIIDAFNNFDFVLPKYQRKFVWDQEQIAKLALSVIKNIPIPPLYVYIDHDGARVILDGQQRIISLFLYYNDLTVKNRKKYISFYEITEEHRKTNSTFQEIISNKGNKISEQFKKTKYIVGDNTEITYSTLNRTQKRMLAGRFIDVVFLEVRDQGKESVYSDIFNLLNSGGSPLTRQEVRNGVYRSPFYDEIHRLNNNNKNWRNLFGAQHERSRDVELLLRLVALDHYTEVDEGKIIFKSNEENVSYFKGSYSLMLDNYSQEALKFNDIYIGSLIGNLEEFFEKFVLLRKEDLEIKSNKTIDHLLLEALYVAYIKNNKSIICIDNALINKIKGSPEYRKTMSTSTSNKKNVEDRLTEVYNIVKC